MAATPAEVKRLVCESSYEKYERLLLQLSLAEMEDVVWCPRCEYPALLHDSGGTLATCGKCGFSFCTDCRQTWHGLEPCANLAERWKNGDEAARAALREKVTGAAAAAHTHTHTDTHQCTLPRDLPQPSPNPPPTLPQPSPNPPPTYTSPQHPPNPPQRSHPTNSPPT